MVFAKAGVKKIYAMDASDSVLAETPKALEKNLTLEERKRIILVKGDMRWFSLPEQVDLVTIAFYSFWYNFGIHPRRPSGSTEKTENLALHEAVLCLRSIVKVLRCGGEFIIHSPLNMEFSGVVWSTEGSICWWRSVGAQLGFSFYICNYNAPASVPDSEYGSVLVGHKL